MFTGILKDELADVYHSRKGYISSSPLPEMKKSPAHFYQKWTQVCEPTDAMVRGTFFHDIILEQNLNRYVKRPLTAKGSLVASNTKEYLAFLEANPGKIPIAPDMYDDAMAILTAACNSNSFMKAFEVSDKECSFYAHHAASGCFLKARADVVAKDFSFILDVKSTADITKFEKQLFEMAYDVRLIHYIQTIKAITGKEIPEVYFFVIESKAPFASRMFQLSPDAIEAALVQWNQWISKISVCISESKWPSFGDDIVTIERPKYLQIESVSFEEIA